MTGHGNHGDGRPDGERKPRDNDSQGTRRQFSNRYTVIAVAFILISVLYIVSIASIQLNYEPTKRRTETETERTEPIEAMRGEIFDRNGKALVTNDYSYSLVLNYGTMPDTYTAGNRSIIAVMQALSATGCEDKRCGDSWVFSGSYPNIVYDPEKLTDENLRARLARVKKALELDTDASAYEVIEKLARKCRILDSRGRVNTDDDGRPLYTYEEITTVLRVRYEMEVIRFAKAQPLTIAEDVSEELITYVAEHEIEGAMIKTTVSRVYHYPGIASHILGRVGSIPISSAEEYAEQGYAPNAKVGVSGVEKAFEQYLRGMDGERVIVEDSEGHVIDTYVSKEPQAGNDIWLTIDIELQAATEQALAENIAYILDTEASSTDAVVQNAIKNGSLARAGAMTVINPKTGEVLALASNPTYDLSTFSQNYEALSSDPRAPLVNRALSGTYPPGSTFKVGIAVAALSEHIVSPSSTVHCSGQYTYYDDYQPKCWNIWGHGDLDATHAIGASCNVIFFEMGRLLTIDNINKYCRLYGFGQPTGIELTDVENTGVLADPEYARDNGLEWTAGRVIATAIGQGYNSFNPLQISCYMSMIVNQGVRYSAHLLGSVREFHTGRIIYSPDPEIAASFDMSDSTYKTVMDGMGLVVSSPTSMTSRYLADYPVKVGAKTGTAQVGDGSVDNCVFAAFAPFDDPEIVFSCVIEHGVNGYYAAMGAKQVFNSYFGFTENKAPDGTAG